MNHTMDDSISKFLCLFDDIEDFLKTITNTLEKKRDFGDLVRDSSDSTKVLAKYAVVVREVAEELRHLAFLRNFLIHHHKHERRLALPHPNALARITSIRDRLRQPASLIDVFGGREVVECGPEELVGKVAARMLDKNLSQIPVCCGPNISALLTTDTIARWLAESLARIGGMTEEAPVKDVLLCAEQKEDNYELLAPNDTVIDALGWFDRCLRSRRRLDAILITEGRAPKTPILDIITAFDIPTLYAQLRLPPEVKAKKPST